MSLILTARDGPVLRIQINRPEKKNALTAATSGFSTWLTAFRNRNTGASD